ncbi:protein of unknown function [Filimonas lacunae]|uniref:Uncharacterized protein n=1 Tax=Filimonas lacunae TaxID=477680 RepID=A0A173MCL8_9BACT|nr:DUF4878 domain-containing protein [Filimonas lacunae]BAV05229.1 hypothetical protein FLA_1236 [Filimonas lacunae]SIT22499.1 protein of unknown function [Filimonas lacunae]
MKTNVLKRMTVWLLPVLLLAACGGKQHNYPQAENSLDAAREFIDGYLKGDFDKALFYMAKDSANLQNLQKMQIAYTSKSANDKKQYKQASIIINQVEALDDSTDIINYKNSFDRIARKVKVIKAPGGWLVDFKYTISGNI